MATTCLTWQPPAHMATTFLIRQVMNVVLPELPRGLGAQRVWRARFSAVSEASVTTAMSRLGEPNEAEASAVDARQELDLMLGVTTTTTMCHSNNDHVSQQQPWMLRMLGCLEHT